MVTIIPRTSWQSPDMPVTGPKMVLSTIRLLPAHYTAAANCPDNTPLYLRSIQRDYVTNRGYSIGYNFAIDKTGAVYECRGWDIKCAANVNRNTETIAILCLVDGSQPMNAKMVESFKALGAEAQRRCNRSLTVVGHRDIGATACPGDGIYAQVKAGKLTPGDTPDPVPPTPTPTPGDDTMTIRIFESQTDPKEFNAMFFAECDGQNRSIELQWSGDGDDPRVQERIQVMMENWGPPLPLLLAGVKNNRLHCKHKPSDIIDAAKQGGWTDLDFAP